MNIVTKARNILRMVPAFSCFGFSRAVSMAMEVNQMVERKLPILDPSTAVVNGYVVLVEDAPVLIEGIHPIGLLPAPKE